MKSIYEFKKGDIITRVEPSAPLGKGGFFGDEGFQDRSYIGERYILAGIANGCVYLKRTDEIENKIFGDRLIDLPLDIFENGWNYWIDPQTGQLSYTPPTGGIGLGQKMAKAAAWAKWLV